MDRFKVINSFKNIDFGVIDKPLVICDIDHTTIKPKYDINYYRKKLKNDFIDKDDREAMAKSMYHMSVNMGLIKPTDLEGFNWLVEETKRLNGKFIFLTARGDTAHKKTLKDLFSAGISNPNQYKIHYTEGKINKGDYIKKNNLTDGFNHIYFIDDYPEYLKSAINIYPNMNCYLFKYN